MSILEPATSNTFSEKTQLASVPVIIDGEPEYEISWIVNSKIDHQWACKLLYKVIWLGYEDTEDKSEWIPTSKLIHATDLVSNFHIAYLTKPSLLPLSWLHCSIFCLHALSGVFFFKISDFYFYFQFLIFLLTYLDQKKENNN